MAGFPLLLVANLTVHPEGVVARIKEDIRGELDADIKNQCMQNVARLLPIGDCTQES